MGRTHYHAYFETQVSNFNSLAPCGANQRAHGHNLVERRFQLTRPVWGEPRVTDHQSGLQNISTHSPRVGRTVMDRNTVSHFSDFNSLAPCGANRWYFWTSLTFTLISTHSPRVGRTGAYSLTSDSDSNFNSLAPCGANQILLIIRRNTNKFQLTRPVWGEPNGLLCSFRHTSISTHSPRVGRTKTFSTH